jgi:hypothetical protein
MPTIINGTDNTAATPALTGADPDTGIFFPAADTIAFAEGGAEVARFNSSGNLGIGNTNPTFAKLVVIGSGTSASIMTNTAAAFNGGANAFNIGDDGTDVLIGPGNSGSKLTLLSRAGGVYSRALTVDSAGQITAPLQPSFRAYATSAQSPVAGAVIVFNNDSATGMFNTGGHYNTSNGRFTAPVTGVYAISFSVLFQSCVNGQYGDTSIYRNGSTAINTNRIQYQSTYTGYGGYLEARSSVVIKLTAGDFITVNNGSANTQSLYVNDASWTWFSGYLLG